MASGSESSPVPSLLSPTGTALSAGSYATRQQLSANGGGIAVQPAQPVAVTAGNPPNGPAGTGQQSSLSPRRRARLQRSERLQSDHSQSSQSPSYSSWEALIRDSFGQIVWPIRITSWEMVQSDRMGGGGAATGAGGFMAGGRNASYHAPDYVAASTSATELISRRGVFSRRHYGSVDQLPQSEIDGLDPNCRRFRLENGESLAEKDEVFGSPSIPILENPEHQTRWYFKYFLGKLHQNYVGMDSEKSPYFLSIVSQDSGSKCMPLYRVMLFRKQGAQKLALPYNPQQKLTVKQILSNFTLMDSNKSPKEIFAADIQKDLLLLEEQEGSVNFKFGVVYMKAGQKLDDEMLSNETGSPEFDDFLTLLGEKIRLKDWERYRGGLDVKGDMTGKYSIYTLYEGHEIMFHVSTLLPFSRDNRQQVERKRHIGNDIVNIIFIDEASSGEETEFIPNNVKSQFTHVFAVVTKRGTRYRLAVYCDETVPPFGPTLPNPPEFEDPAVFRDFLLVKLINGEKATFQTPTFARKRERTLEMLIKDLYEEYVHDNKMNMLNRRAFSEVLYDAPRTSKLKEDARQVEFVRIGQALKLEAIVRGDAPTSIASAGTVFKRPPWEPHCFYPTFQPRNELVGDSWGQDQLFLASDEGTYLIKEDQTHRVVFDKTLCVRQLNVVEDHGIMLVRGGSAMQKDGHRIHVFRLNEFTDDRLVQRSRVDVKERRIEKTRGCHLYAISRAGEAHLRMAVAVGRKLLIYQWKHTAAWTSWCPNSDNDTVEGFLFLKEIHLHDSPTIMTILEGSCPNAGLLICVGYRHHFEIVSELTGHGTKLHETDTTKRTQTHLVAALDLYDGQDTELLLCYNHTCHFQKLSEECNNSTEFDFQFNTPPSSVVCAFPYIIAFTPDTMEIRLLVNGNLVHTVTMAELQLITSKKDIFFVTTAPEFIPKGAKLRGLDAEDHEQMNKPRIEESRVVPEDDASTSPARSRLSSDEDNSGGAPSTAESDPNGAESGGGQLTTPQIQRAKSLQNPNPAGEPAKPKEVSLSVDELKRPIAKSNSYGEAGTSFSIPTTTCSKDLAKHFGAQPLPNTKDLCRHFGEASVPPNSPRNSTIVKGTSPSSPTRKSFIRQPTLNLGKAQTSEGETSPSNGSASSSKPLRVYRIPLTNLTGTHVQSHHYHYPSNDPAKKPVAIATKMHPSAAIAAAVVTRPSESAQERVRQLQSSNEEDEEGLSPSDESRGELAGAAEVAPVPPALSIFDQIQQDLQELSMKDKHEQGELCSSVLTPL
uniref:GTPase-activating Rap/Ran-GAP domain-like protein 3 isoform X2 n=1 Tax=Anopheles coluzzii TaxID=1518534 RepID=UPI0020FFDA8E|nr:GTPase-activating Rap/Ran-GAP domain-like protein 3 isoform X2 [Anopheles coluzzii]XP_040223874.2 GTPase-activating Rap/Ran-GAP domain-like protein 3 isoform X2 [Anopheles coluzzii]XP_049461475.1 GTPase-activating Rap/Ran-GAP domain-like protein 3 isoform X2 [Anopheles coluzzii]